MSKHNITLALLVPMVAPTLFSCYPADQLEPIEEIAVVRYEPCARAESLLAYPPNLPADTIDWSEAEDSDGSDENGWGDTSGGDDLFPDGSNYTDDDLVYSDDLLLMDEFFDDLEYESDIEPIDTSCMVPVAAKPAPETLPGVSLPCRFALSQNYPNPFNATTLIVLTLPSIAAWSLTIFNTLGQVVTKWEGISSAGTMTFHWDASDLASGIYICRAEAAELSDTRKMLLLR